MPNFISEDDIEQAILQELNQQHHFKLLNCFTAERSNRTDKRDVIFSDRLKSSAPIFCFTLTDFPGFHRTQKLQRQTAKRFRRQSNQLQTRHSPTLPHERLLHSL